jgi:hypothetical protein
MGIKKQIKIGDPAYWDLNHPYSSIVPLPTWGKGPFEVIGFAEKDGKVLVVMITEDRSRVITEFEKFVTTERSNDYDHRCERALSTFKPQPS